MGKLQDNWANNFPKLNRLHLKIIGKQLCCVLLKLQFPVKSVDLFKMGLLLQFISTEIRLRVLQKGK